ncbi:Ig-like domain-containing protein, partial [Winogradskyella tangerina]|uniref:Ig-like domain-containing protein n=1 Tax=Winogradskyella tangerina TaxID=2023240 RepID=UPI001E3EAD90
MAKALAILLLVIMPNILLAQQSPSIQTGVTFQWEDTQSNNSDPATIRSVTIDGTVYNTFVVPTSYELTILGPDGHNPNNIRLNGGIVVGTSNAANWVSAATTAFQSKNLNHYFEASSNGQDFCSDFDELEDIEEDWDDGDGPQKQTIFYSPAIPANDGGVLAVTERGGNNCFYIEVYGTPAGGGLEQKLGETFVRNSDNYRDCNFGPPNAGSDYWQSGRCNENGQTIGVALFHLNEIAPTGSNITRIEFVAATRDHGDGKFFLLQKYAVDDFKTGCIDQKVIGDLGETSNAPDGSTFTLISGPTPAGDTFTFNADGTYSYVPTAGYTGTVTFDFEVCLPAPNTSVCDQATVTLNFVDLPPAPTASVSCGSTSDDFTITITSPLGPEFEYALNGGNYQSSTDFTGLAEGTYSISVKSGFTECPLENALSITLSNLELSGSVTDVLCRTEATGAIDINVGGGEPPYTFSWNNGDTTEDLSNVIAGNYTVTVTDANGCTISQNFTINQPSQQLSSTRAIEDVLCNGDNTGSIDLTVSGGTAPYSYLWSNGETTEDILNLTAGTYTVTITDANGCTTTNSGTVTEPVAIPCQITVDNCPPTVDISCSNDDLGTPVYWTPPSFAYQCCTSSPGDDYSFNVEFDLPESGNACWEYNRVQRIGSNNLRLFQSSGTNVNFTTPLSYFDTSSGVDINMELIVPNGAFDWTIEVLDNTTVVYSSTIFAIASSGLQTIIIPSSVPSGAYKLRFNFDDNGTNLNASDQIEVDRLYYNATLLESACLDGVNFAVTSNFNPGDSFPDGNTTVIYTATYTYPDGSTDQLTCDFSVEVFDIELTESAVDKEDVTCNGESDGSFTINATGGTAPYLFSLDNIDFSNTTGVFENLSAGNYTVYVKDDNDCEETIDIIISEPDILEAVIVSTTNVDCSGANGGSIEASAIGGTPPFEFSIDNGTTNQSSVLFENLTNGTYTILVTDANNCTASIDGIIGINDTESPQISVPSTIDLEGCTTSDITSANSVFDFNDTGSGDVQAIFASNPNYNASDDFNIQIINYIDSVTSVNNCPITVLRTFTITDNCGNTATATQTITVADTTDPIINVPADITIECTDDESSANTGVATGSDTCGTVTITESDVETAACGNTKTIVRTWTVTDECGNAVSADQTITVIDTTDPIINVPADITIECTDDESSANTGVATGSDTCGTVTITESDVETAACGNTKTIVRTWTVTDECGNAVSADQTITVIDTTDPIINVPADITIECTDDESSAYTGVATGSDTCGTVTITESDVETAACGNTKTIVRTWTVTDECGNAVSADQTITVIDTTDPIINVPADITIECTDDESSANTGVATGSDTCGTVTITESDVETAACGNTKTIVRTWTVTDECGNAVSADQTITVIDTTDPIINVPADITIECTDDESSANTGVATGSDTCGTVTITESDVETAACGNTKTIVRTWTVTDECGNAVSADQTITVIDTTDPIINVPADITIECTDDESSANTGVATGSDTCGTVTITESDVETAACGNTKTIVRTWTVTDECGNAVSADQTITVIDTTDPIINVPADITIECTDDESSANTGVATGSDTC